MSLPDFYIKVLDSFNHNQVEYLIIGGHAVNYHGYLRATLDMDIWINQTNDNLNRLAVALVDLGYNEKNCNEAIRIFKENHIITLPHKNIIIELMDSFIVKADFEKLYLNREILHIDNIQIAFIGFEDLIECKYRTNRVKDLLDVKELKEIKKIHDNKSKNRKH